jgi:hypothetical protein
MPIKIKVTESLIKIFRFLGEIAVIHHCRARNPTNKHFNLCFYGQKQYYMITINYYLLFIYFCQNKNVSENLVSSCGKFISTGHFSIFLFSLAN